MTTGTSRDDRRRAAELLDVAEDAPREEVRRAYLERLRDHDFQPPRSLRHALRVLEGRGRSGDRRGSGLRRGGAPARRGRIVWRGVLRTPSRRAPPALGRAVLRVPGRAAARGPAAGAPGGAGCRDRRPPAGRGVLRPASPSRCSATSRCRRLPRPLPARRSSFASRSRPPRPSARPGRRPPDASRADWPAVAALDEEFVRHVAELRRRLGRRAGRPRREVASAVEGESDSWVGPPSSSPSSLPAWERSMGTRRSRTRRRRNPATRSRSPRTSSEGLPSANSATRPNSTSNSSAPERVGRFVSRPAPVRRTPGAAR